MITKVTWDATKNNHSSTVFSNNDLTAYIYNNNQTIVANVAKSTGKWYFELKMESAILNTFVGVVSADIGYGSTFDSNLSRYYKLNGTKSEGSTSTTYGTSYKVGDVIGVALDLDNGTLSFYKNGVAQGDDGGVAFTNLSSLGKVYPAFTTGGGSSSNKITANFGDRAFTYPAPSGYKAYGSLPKNKILLKSNNKAYSFKSEDTVIYETKMTSNTAPSPFKANASDIYNANYEAWTCFNGDIDSTTSHWRTKAGVIESWISLDFGTRTRVNMVTMYSRNVNDWATISPKKFIVQGSTDGLNWVNIKTFSNVTNWIAKKAPLTFEFSNDIAYRHYRIYILESNGSTSVGLGEIVFGYKEICLINLPIHSRENFIQYGVLPPLKFNPTMINKNYILQDTVSENADGLWVQEIDRKPLSIKFE